MIGQFLPHLEMGPGVTCLLCHMESRLTHGDHISTMSLHHTFQCSGLFKQYMCLLYWERSYSNTQSIFLQVQAIGGLPDKIYDIWDVTGQRKEAKFTWDQVRNDNLEFASKFKPRCRFDRLYVRHSEPKTVNPVYFELCGLERLKSCQRFCSDHWGLLTHFNILSKVPKQLLDSAYDEKASSLC